MRWRTPWVLTHIRPGWRRWMRVREYAGVRLVVVAGPTFQDQGYTLGAAVDGVRWTWVGDMGTEIFDQYRGRQQ